MFKAPRASVTTIGTALTPRARSTRSAFPMRIPSNR